MAGRCLMLLLVLAELVGAPVVTTLMARGAFPDSHSQHLGMPGIAGAALLAFSLSFDDFIITNFNSGTFSTFPKFVYVSAARGIPAQANVIGTAMFFIALIIVIVGQVVSKQRRRS